MRSFQVLGAPIWWARLHMSRNRSALGIIKHTYLAELRTYDADELDLVALFCHPTASATPRYPNFAKA